MAVFIVRPATEPDFDAIECIYADAVLHTAASFEIEPPSATELRARWRRLVDAGYPYLVAEADLKIAGYCYAGPFRDRAAYRFTVESSVYVAEPFRRTGGARALMQRLIEQCRVGGFRQMIAVISGINNAASIGLHQALGFEQVGVMRGIGRKFECWQDVMLMQRNLVP